MRPSDRDAGLQEADREEQRREKRDRQRNVNFEERKRTRRKGREKRGSRATTKHREKEKDGGYCTDTKSRCNATQNTPSGQQKIHTNQARYALLDEADHDEDKNEQG